jgi:hypothetical protein
MDSTAPKRPFFTLNRAFLLRMLKALRLHESRRVIELEARDAAAFFALFGWGRRGRCFFIAVYLAGDDSDFVRPKSNGG